MIAAALLSRCLYRSLSTSLSFFMVFLLGCRSMAWKFTGSPYLEKTQYMNTLIKIFSTAVNKKDVSKIRWYFYFLLDVWVTLSLYFWAHYLRTDSTNTLSALMWIHAMKASLKFTFSHRTRGPCREEMQIRVIFLFGCGSLESRPNRTGRFILLQSTRKNVYYQN